MINILTLIVIKKACVFSIIILRVSEKCKMVNLLRTSFKVLRKTSTQLFFSPYIDVKSNQMAL